MSGRRDALDRVPGLARLYAAQDAVCTRAQLALVGVSPHDVARHELARRWATIGPLVVVMHRGPLTDGARRTAALLHCGPGAAWCAWTALEVAGLRGWERETTHVIVGRGLTPEITPAELGPVDVHESRRHYECDVVIRRGCRTHTPERAAVDVGAWSGTDRSAAGVIAAVVQQRLTTPERLQETLTTVGKVKRLRLMNRVVADVAGGSQALSEIDFVRFCRRRGLPEPVRQAIRLDSRGRRRYLDVEWRLPSGRRLWVEIDGVGHLDVERWYDDLLRAAEIQAVGRDDAPVRLPAMACRAEPDHLEALLRALLGLVRL